MFDIFNHTFETACILGGYDRLKKFTLILREN